MKNKNLVFVLFLLCATCVFSKPTFSLSWENSFLTGKADFEQINKLYDWNYEEKMKGGQSLLTFRSQFNKYFSLGIGSGIGINKLNYASTSDFNNTDLLIPDSIPVGYVPIFGELRGILPINGDLLSLYLSSKIGGSILWQEFRGWKIIDYSAPFLEYDYFFAGGFFFEPEFGVSLKLKRFLLDLGAGYHLQKLKYEVNKYDRYGKLEYEKTYPFDIKQFFVKLGLGIQFGKIK